MASASPRGECQDVRGSPPGRAARLRAGGPTLDRATVMDCCQTLRTRPMSGRGQQGHDGFFWLARCTIAWARRTYLLSARSRTLLTSRACSKASASPLDRPRAVTGASASAVNLSTAGWSSGGRWMSECSTIHASRCRLRWTRQPLVVGGPPCPCPPGAVLAGEPESAGGPLLGGDTLVGGAETLGGDAGFCRWASALVPAAMSWQ